MNIAHWGFVILLASPAGVAVAQSQQDQAPAQQEHPSAESQSGQKPDGLADAARRAKEQKKDQAKAAKVWDNDSIPAVGGTINVVGQAAAPPTPDDATANQANGAAQPGQGNAGAAQGGKPTAAMTAELTTAKAELESLQKDLDLLQRKFTLDQQTFLSNPDHDSNRGGASLLQSEQEAINAKQQEIADAQRKMDELQTKINVASSGSKQ
jgi:hypothetical protein